MGDQFKLVKLLDGLNINISNNALSNYTATTMPGISDDNTKGYGIGSHWIDVSADEIYVAVDVSTNLAVWKNLSLDQTEIDHVNIQSIGVKTHATLDSEVNSLLTDQHTHANKALLDTYTQTDIDIADAISKEHVHANIVALDAVSGTNTGDQDLSSLVVGPLTSTDNAVARYDLTTGKIIQDSNITISDIGDILPITSTAQSLGSASLPFEVTFATLGIFVRRSGANNTLNYPTSGSNDGGLIAGTMNGSGTKTMTLGGGSYPAVCALGNVAANSGGTATLQSISGGASCFGSAYAYGSGTATVESKGFCSFAAGYAYGSGTSLLSSSASGSLAFGYANGKAAGSTAIVRSNGSGSFSSGFVTTNTNGAVGQIISSAKGSFSVGTINSTGVFTGTIRSSGNGSFAQGYAKIAGANVSIDTQITSSGKGSFAQGYVQGGTIAATATNAVQFGVGTNATPDSFQMGSGIHIEANGIIHWMKEIATPAIPAANHHSVYFDVSGDDKMRIQDDLNNVEIVCSSVLIERQYAININQFRNGATAPADATIGTTPTIPALRFSAINELVSLEVPIPDNWDNATDIKIRLHMNLVNAQTDLDTIDCTFDYVAPILNSTGNGITKTSSQVTSQVIVTTANGLAIADRYDMLVTIPFTDVNNGLLNAHAICLEMHLTNITGVGSVDITGAHLIYTSEY